MTRVELLKALMVETEIAVADLLLPVPMQKTDEEQPPDRVAKVYLMRPPDGKAATKKAPYIIHQFITGADEQPSGEEDRSEAVVRSIFCVYNEDGEAGGIALLTLMERLRFHLLRKVVIGGQFELNKQAKLEAICYPDETAPYYLGEFVSSWRLPAIEREVKFV